MSQKVDTLSMVRMDGERISQARKQVIVVVVSLMAVALVAVSAYLLVSVFGPDVSPEIVAGVEASSARWSAMGVAYAPDYEAIAEVSSARWSALGEQYLAEVAQGQ